MTDKQHLKLILYALFIFTAVTIAAYLFLNDQLQTQALFSNQPSPKIGDVEFRLD